MFHDEDIEKLRKEFGKNQKKIDSRKTSKEERRDLIQRNREILNELNDKLLSDYEKGEAK